MNDNTNSKVPNEAYVKTRDYFLGNSLTPSENVPDLLAENRKIAVGLAESVMSLMDVIANYFGIPTMELAMETLPKSPSSLRQMASGSRQPQGHIWTSKAPSPWRIFVKAHMPIPLLRCTVWHKKSCGGNALPGTPPTIPSCNAFSVGAMRMEAATMMPRRMNLTEKAMVDQVGTMPRKTDRRKVIHRKHSTNTPKFLLSEDL